MALPALAAAVDAASHADVRFLGDQALSAPRADDSDGHNHISRNIVA
jgi:hypothetical protein